MIRVSFPGFSPTRWQVGEKTGGMGVLRGKFSSIWASFFWGVKNEEFFSWQSWSVKNAIHAWFQNSKKTSKKKSHHGAVPWRALIGERRKKKFWWPVGIFLLIGDSDSVVAPKLNLLIQFQYIYEVQCVDLRNRWPIAFYCAMHVVTHPVTTERCNLSLVHDKFRFMRKVSGVANSLQG